MNKNIDENPIAPEQTSAAEPETPDSDAPEAPDKASELTAWQDKYIRLAAEYDNFRKRTARERESFFADGMLSAAGAMLPVLDNLERAANEPCSDESYKQGVNLIYKQLTEALGKLSIVETPGVGEPFDPNVHNAVIHVEDETLGENVVAEVLQKGFLMNGRVLRCAMVKVAN